MNDQLNEIVEKLRQAQNVLVALSKSPSVDQLAAAIGLTTGLNNLGKHATAVYSGETPSTIEFLKPETTLKKNTDSLRDFIIALDKAKADKLRYKVEDSVVRIYVTPLKTTLSEKDLTFSQGDFNVDVVVALGVKEQADLDEAIRAHGRIFHSADVISLDASGKSDIGTLNYSDESASSLSEIAADLLGKLDTSSLDSQVATSLLTGIVSMTERFSNGKTSPRTMSTSAALMAAGANQQLVSAELSGGGSTDNNEELPKVQDAQVESTIQITQTQENEASSSAKAEPEQPVANDNVEVAGQDNDLLDGQTSEISVDADGHLSLVSDKPDVSADPAKAEINLPSLDDRSAEAQEDPVAPTAEPPLPAPDLLQVPASEPPISAPINATPTQGKTLAELESDLSSQPQVMGGSVAETAMPEPLAEGVTPYETPAVANNANTDVTGARQAVEAAFGNEAQEPPILQHGVPSFTPPAPVASASLPPQPTAPTNEYNLPNTPALAPSMVPPVPSGNVMPPVFQPNTGSTTLQPAPFMNDQPSASPPAASGGVTPPPVPPPMLPQ